MGQNLNKKALTRDFHFTENATKDKVLEGIQTKLDALTHKDTLQKVKIVHLHLPEWDLVPFPETYQAPNINK